MALQEKHILLITRVLSLLSIAAIVTIGVIQVFSDGISLVSIVRGSYLVFFGVLLALAELRVLFFLKYFNFMASNLGRGLYIIFLGTILLGGQLYSLIVGFCVVFGGIIYLVLGRKIKETPTSEEADTSNIKQTAT